MIPYKYQRLLRRGLQDDYGWSLWRENWPEIKRELWPLCLSAIAVDTSPIKHILEQHTLAKTNIFPPWPVFWIELSRFGGLLVSTKQIDRDFDFLNLSDFTNTDELVNGYEYTLYWLTEHKSGAFLLAAMFAFFVNHNGELLADGNRVFGRGIEGYGIKRMVVVVERGVTEIDGEPFLAFCNLMTKRVSHFISFMQCRNIKVKSRHFPDYKPRKHQRHPIYKYYELTVVKPTINEINRHNGEGIKGKALHTCRGHIRHYSEDKPLFGISGLHGDYFIPQHIRGNIKYGKIEKTYKAKAAKF